MTGQGEPPHGNNETKTGSEHGEEEEHGMVRGCNKKEEKAHPYASW